MENEGRLCMLQLQDPQRAKELAAPGQAFVNKRYESYQQLCQTTDPS